MNKIKLLGATLALTAAIDKEEWIFIIGVIITVLGMIQEYLKQQKIDKLIDSMARGK